MSLAYTIRSIASADEPFLWDMLYLAIFVPEGVPHPPRDILKAPEIAKYVQSWGKEGDQGLIAVDAHTQQSIGAVWLRFFSGTAPGYGYVADDIPELSMALLPEYRGQGIGTRLLGELLVSASNNRAISLSVDPDNPAFALYERFEFRTVGASGTSVTMLRTEQM